MGKRLGRLGLISIILSLSSTVTCGLHSQICQHDSDCHSPQVTFMKCLDDPEVKRKICGCNKASQYIKSKDQCFIIPGGTCSIETTPGEGETLQQCVPGAYCSLHDYDGATKGLCVCSPDHAENPTLGICEAKAPPAPGVSCRSDSDCRDSFTFLRCLSKPKVLGKQGAAIKEKICECRKSHKFDGATNQCRIKIGGDCKRPGGASRVQDCVPEAICIPHKESDGASSSSGVCCSVEGGRVSCSEFGEKPPEGTKKLKTWGQECRPADEDCDNHSAFLRCLKEQSTPPKFVCHCGRNNIYSHEKGKCLLGIGNACNMSTYQVKKPQECIPLAECVPHKDTSGKAVRAGKCICKSGLESSDCSPDKHPSSGQHTGGSAKINFSQFILYAILGLNMSLQFF